MRTTAQTTLRIAQRLRLSESEGPFRRYVLWLQGCSIRCPGCCNPEFFDSDGGQPLAVGELLLDIKNAQKQHALEGVTLLGGEPLEQSEALLELLKGIKKLQLGVLLFTGYKLEQVKQFRYWGQLKHLCDTLVDGPFVATQAESSGDVRTLIGSQNQSLHHFSSRYADPALWSRSNAAEIQISADGSMSLHGFPTKVLDITRTLKKLRSQGATI